MRYCSNCGTKVINEAIYCPECSHKIDADFNEFVKPEEPIVITTPAEKEEKTKAFSEETKRKVNILGIISLCFGVLSVVVFVLLETYIAIILALVSLVLGIISLIKKCNQKGFGIAGVSIGAYTIVLCSVIIIIALFHGGLTHVEKEVAFNAEDAIEDVIGGVRDTLDSIFY